MQVQNDSGGPYLDVLDVTALLIGRWFKTSGDPTSMTLTGELTLAGGGNVSGELFADFTADPAELLGITRLTLPDGCLHTAFATVTLAAQKVVLAAALTATTFGFTLSYPVCGSMRFRWLPTGVGSIVAGTNKLTMHCQMGQDN